MMKYTLFFVGLFLVVGLGCQPHGQRSYKEIRDNNVTVQEQIVPTVDDANGDDIRDEATPGPPTKPTNSVQTVLKSAVNDVVSPQHIAIDLVLQELALNLRLKEEQDPAKRDELQREMSKLREQRKSLYESQVQGE